VVGQRLDHRPALAIVVTDEESGRLGPGIQQVPDAGQRPDLAEALAVRRGLVRPADRLGEFGIVGGPLVDLSGGEFGDRPGVPAVGGSPYAGTGPLAAATGPQVAGSRITDDVIDRPAVAIGSADGPPITGCGAVEDEGTLRRAEQDANGVLGQWLYSSLR